MEDISGSAPTKNALNSPLSSANNVHPSQLPPYQTKMSPCPLQYFENLSDPPMLEGNAHNELMYACIRH